MWSKNKKTKTKNKNKNKNKTKTKQNKKNKKKNKKQNMLSWLANLQQVWLNDWSTVLNLLSQYDG